MSLLGYRSPPCCAWPEVDINLRTGNRTLPDVQLAIARYSESAEESANMLVSPQSQPLTGYLVWGDDDTLISNGVNCAKLAERYPDKRIETVPPSRYRRRKYAAYLRECDASMAQWHAWHDEGRLSPAFGFSISDVSFAIVRGCSRGYSAWWRNREIGWVGVWSDLSGLGDIDTVRTPSDAWVAEPFQRRGVATLMYQFAQHDLERQGLEFLPSGAQSDDARAFWAAWNPTAVTRRRRRLAELQTTRTAA